MTQDYDLIVLGAGSGGVAASRRAALHGARVAIVEAGRVGGTCVLRGCVPKKLLMYAAQFGEGFAEARGYGWALADPRFDMGAWQALKTAETSRLEGVYRRMLETGKVELIEGFGRLAGPGRVQMGERVLTTQHVLVATGASPVRDSIPGIEAAATSDDLLDLDHLPARAAVVGSGYIAVEFASMLARLGVAVSMFYRADRPLRGFDAMLRGYAAEALTAAGVELHPGRLPVRVQRRGGGFVLGFADGAARDFPWVLNATGRRPNTQGLGLETVGLAPAADGALAVDDTLHTAAAGVHAIGDVTNRKNLTPVAIAEGRALADALFGGPAQAQRTVDLSLVASAVFMLPPLASIGPSEEELAGARQPTQVYEADFRPMKQTFFGGSQRTRMKLLVDAASDRVRAVHMAGADAPEIVQSLAVALSARATKADFDRTIAVHPTAAEEFVLMRSPSRTVGTVGTVGTTPTAGA